jgi:hypothetical protein
MTSFNRIGLVIAALALTSAVGVAAEKHNHHGSHGGQVRETASYDLELAAKDKELSLYVQDHAGKKVDVKGGTATAIVMTGITKETVKLTPAGENVLRGTGGFTVTPDTKVIVSITLGAKTEQARFTPMEKEKPDAHKGHKH